MNYIIAYYNRTHINQTERNKTMAEAKVPPKEVIESIVDGKRDFEEVKAMLSDPKNGHYINAPIDDLETYLVHRAARAGNMPLVQFILEQKPEQAKFHKESNGADVLQHAVVSGNLDLVKYVISKGADPHYRYFMETSIMYFAVKYGHIHIFKYFVEEHKMDPHDILAANGIQALYMAMEQNDKELFKYILSFNPHIENIGPYNYLAFAARLDDTFYLEELLNRNAPFEIMEPYDRSAFSWAGEDNRHKQMELLLKRAKGIKPEALLAPGISKVSHEYNALCHKWWRLYDIYMVRYFCELQRKEVEPKGDTKKFLEDEKLHKIYEVITTAKDKYESLIFKIPRNIFKGVMKYLETPQPDIKVPEPQNPFTVYFTSMEIDIALLYS
eukprot:TRINITY_DN154_c1_g1_i1.p1 TRINITY_DN154_c1_g1~~TRINITY_DN154_c1_g1_i1.p1  ORF type:complete len:415 (+),score=51.03 TRINITY_DN154_c1_g1_i1:93-1247(+)